MFIDKKDLIKVEHEFQKSTLVLSHSDYLSSKNEIYILKYDETLIEDYKVILWRVHGTLAGISSGFVMIQSMTVYF